jgi:hypothetical protein
MKTYFEDGKVKLYHGNVMEVLTSMESGSVQTCITSPPYW